MLASTPTKHFSHRNSPYSSPMSPSYTCTPPRRCVNMEPPSPLTSRSPFPAKAFVTGDFEDLFQSPFSSPAPAHTLNPSYSMSKPQPITLDDDEGRIFASANSSLTLAPLFPSSSPQPLLTPVKSTGRAALAVRHLNKQHEVVASEKSFSTRVGIGTKRKSPVHYTPLKINSGATFQRLATLSPPSFNARTPEPKSDPDALIKRHAATLRRLRLADKPEVMDTCDDLDDSGCEMDDDGAEAVLLQKDKSRNSLTLNKGKAKEVAETISPGGHVAKRRARSRPLSAELGEHGLRSPSSPSQKKSLSTQVRPRLSGHITFPSATSYRGRASPCSSSSEGGSPLPRRRINNCTSRPQIMQPPLFSRLALSRDNPSAATLFFGPVITQSDLPPRSRTTTSATLSQSAREPRSALKHTRDPSNRHSYAGSTDSFWSQIQARATTTSSFTMSTQKAGMETNDDEDMTFDGPSQSSFSLCETNQLLPSKYQATDHGSYGDCPSGLDSASSDDNLITPGAESDHTFWGAPGVFGDDTSGVDADEFILRTLVAASKGPMPGTKKVPGTPVKKVRTAFLGPDRPWQSAVASKIGLKEDCDFRMAPRKSLPAAFSGPSGKGGKSLLEQCSESEGEDDSPSGRKNGKYAPWLGLGRPSAIPVATGKAGALVLPRRLMRRSSSGAFSNSSESASQTNTPTRSKGIDWKLPTLRVTSARSASGSSTNSSSPTNGRGAAAPPVLPSTRRPRLSLVEKAAQERYVGEYLSRFERDFETVDELGSGEFGKVIKVRSKMADDVQVYAIKKSKRIEGSKHRLRLREEVAILKHLSEAAAPLGGLDGRHPNVLSYIDSWEEDDALYIRTELCEWGNLSRFLWEYGKKIPRLDESIVWKIIVDLGNGLEFIHDAGIIHLDLKPSNVFITREGRLKIGDFGMASVWPRPLPIEDGEGFEREGDKLYLAPEILQGRYSKAADVFSFGMTILETASNIMVPDQGESWHRLRQEDFSQVDWHGSEELLGLIQEMMRTEPRQRPTVRQVCSRGVVVRARARMAGGSVFAASGAGVLEEVLGRDSMDLCV